MSKQTYRNRFTLHPAPPRQSNIYNHQFFLSLIDFLQLTSISSTVNISEVNRILRVLSASVCYKNCIRLNEKLTL